jgi:hypothetical protein
MNIQNIGIIYSMMGEASSNSKTVSASTGSQKTEGFTLAPDESIAKTEISRAGRTLSQVDGTLSEIGQTVSKVKDQLLEVRRTLPPFRPEDAERVRILRTYIGLRKLIDELTFPPPAKTDQVKEDIQLPALSDTASDHEVDGAVDALSKTEQTIQEKRFSLGTLLGL